MHGENSTDKLFCKPAAGDFLFHSNTYNISWVSLDLDKHLSTLHDWVNMAYTQGFWQMSGSVGLLRSCYQCTLQNPFTHPFIGYCNDRMIAFFEVYSVHADELSQYVQHSHDDAGVHLLLSPNDKPAPDFSVKVVRSFLEYYFSFSRAKYVYAEPDVENTRSIRILSRCGFQYIETIEMSYKMAELHCLSRPAWENSSAN